MLPHIFKHEFVTKQSNFRFTKPMFFANIKLYLVTQIRYSKQNTQKYYSVVFKNM